MNKNKLNAKTSRDDLLRAISDEATKLQGQSEELNELLEFYMDDRESLDVSIYINYKDVLKLQKSIKENDIFLKKFANY